jgi:hypothetical protein
MPFAVGMRVSPCEEAMSRVAWGRPEPVAVLFFDLPKRKDIVALLRDYLVIVVMHACGVRLAGNLCMCRVCFVGVVVVKVKSQEMSSWSLYGCG